MVYPPEYVHAAGCRCMTRGTATVGWRREMEKGRVGAQSASFRPSVDPSPPMSGAVVLEEVILTDCNAAPEARVTSFMVDRSRLLQKGEFFAARLTRWSPGEACGQLRMEAPEAQHRDLQAFLCGTPLSDEAVLSLADTADVYCLDPLLEAVAELRTKRLACLNCRLHFTGRASAQGPCQPLTPSADELGVRCGLCRSSRSTGCECRMPVLPRHALVPA